jgi:hypothetical protein
MHKIGPGAGSGTKQETPQGYEVEFYKAGEFVQFRVYAYTDELLMATRITEWVRDGKLVVSA